jgi:ABC-type sugar transport system permease subunit
VNEAVTRPRAAARGDLLRRWRESFHPGDIPYAVALLLPSLVLFGVFIFYPLVKTFYLGFFRSDPFGLSKVYVGFDQYWEVLRSSDFHNSLTVTVVYTLVTVPTGLVLGLGLALTVTAIFPSFIS